MTAPDGGKAAADITQGPPGTSCRADADGSQMVVAAYNRVSGTWRRIVFDIGRGTFMFTPFAMVYRFRFFKYSLRFIDVSWWIGVVIFVSVPVLWTGLMCHVGWMHWWYIIPTALLVFIYWGVINDAMVRWFGRTIITIRAQDIAIREGAVGKRQVVIPRDQVDGMEIDAMSWSSRDGGGGHRQRIDLKGADGRLLVAFGGYLPDQRLRYLQAVLQTLVIAPRRAREYAVARTQAETGDRSVLARTFGPGKDFLLHVAARECDAELVARLVGLGGDVSCTNADGATPLAYAANHAVANALLRHHADATAADRHGRAPIHHASEGGFVGVLDALVATGADVDAKDQSGWTALFYAKDIETVRFLLAHGADRNAQDHSGWSALDAHKHSDPALKAFMMEQGMVASHPGL